MMSDKEEIAREICGGDPQAPCSRGIVEQCPVGRGTSDRQQCKASIDQLIICGYYETAGRILANQRAYSARGSVGAASGGGQG